MGCDNKLPAKAHGGYYSGNKIGHAFADPRSGLAQKGGVCGKSLRAVERHALLLWPMLEIRQNARVSVRAKHPLAESRQPQPAFVKFPHASQTLFLKLRMCFHALNKPETLPNISHTALASYPLCNMQSLHSGRVPLGPRLYLSMQSISSAKVSQ